MKRIFFLIGYWLVHTAGIFPVTLKTRKEMTSVSLHDPKPSSTPWKSNRRCFLLGLCQIFLILYDVARSFVWHSDDAEEVNSNHRSLREVVIDLIAAGKGVTTICSILISLLNRRGIERLLNDICSLYFAVFGRSDPPHTRKFAYLIVYTILSFVVIAVIKISPSSSAPSFLGKFFSQISHTFTLLYIDVVLIIIFVYLQSIVEGLNRKIKSHFPLVDQWDWKCWKSVSNHQLEDLQKNEKKFLSEIRSTYRRVAEIIDDLNSVYGFLLLGIILFNQTACLLFGFCCISSLFTVYKFEGGNERLIIVSTIACSWCFARISAICHGCEIVVKEVQTTTRYIAAIDASKIDKESKMELLEFLDEIDGRKIRFMASNILSLDYSTLYLILNGTLTYLIIIVQYLSY